MLDLGEDSNTKTNTVTLSHIKVMLSRKEIYMYFKCSKCGEIFHELDSCGCPGGKSDYIYEVTPCKICGEACESLYSDVCDECKEKLYSNPEVMKAYIQSGDESDFFEWVADNFKKTEI